MRRILDRWLERRSGDRSFRKRISGVMHGPSFGSFEEPLFVVSILVLGAVVYFQSLGSYPIQAWDEGVYGTAAKHAVIDGHWIVPHLNWMIWTDDLHLQPFLEKPPLVIWLQAASMHAFGVGEFAVRLQSATFAVLTGLLVYFAGRSLRGSRTGFFAALVFLSTPFVYGGPNAGRFGGTDLAHTFFGSLLVFLVWQAVEDDRPDWLLLAGVVGGVATLVKGFAVAIFGVVAIPLVLAHRGFFRTKEAVVGAAVGAAIALPWPLYAWARYGDTFVQEILVEQVLQRAAGQSTSRPGTTFGFMHYPYFQELPVYFDPWTYFVLPAIAAILWRGVSVSIPFAGSSGTDATENHGRTDQTKSGIRPGAVSIDATDSERMKRLLFLVWWGGSILVVFAFTGNHPWYILPAYVPGGVLVGWLFAETLEGRRPARIATLVGTVGVLLYSFRVATLSPLASPETPRVLARNALAGRFFVVLFVVGIGLVVTFDRLRRWYVHRSGGNRTLPTGQIVAVVVTVAMVAALVGPPPTGGGSLHGQQKRLAESLNAASPERTEVYVHTRVMDGTPFWTFAFYLDRPIAAVSSTGLNGSDAVEYAVVSDRDLEHLKRDYRVLGAYDNPRHKNATAIRFLDRHKEPSRGRRVRKTTRPYVVTRTVG